MYIDSSVATANPTKKKLEYQWRKENKKRKSKCIYAQQTLGNIHELIFFSISLQIGFLWLIVNAVEFYGII